MPGFGYDAVEYDQRSRGITATLGTSDRDDGEPGEGDQLGGGLEEVVGGRGTDTIHAPLGSQAA